MTPLHEWLKPPRTLLLILYLLALVFISALGAFGWKLLEQERIVEVQRTQERLEQAADRIAATVRGSLAEAGERLGAWESGPLTGLAPEQGFLLLLTEKGVSATPADQLLFSPVASSEPETAPPVFAEGEMFEFAQNQPEEALRTYERLVNSTGPAIRAGAWLRIARILRNTNRLDESRRAYEKLAAIPGVNIAGAPAELIALHALCELSSRSADADALRSGLLKGQWFVSHGQFAFYWSEANRLSGKKELPPAAALARAEIASRVWAERETHPSARGQETVWIGGEPFFLLWRGAAEHRAVFVTKPQFFLKETPAAFAVVDAEGRVVAGQRTGGARAAVRTAAETQLPWTLYVSADPQPGAGFNDQRRFLLLSMTVMVLFLMSGTYFIARAIRRESETLRMQSDFVSAVSHEFRSPLTSLRQLSEILAQGRVPSEERRQVYYDTLVKETTRLQRLIEALLNFGRMEAGGRQFRFEELDAALLVQRVVNDFEAQIAGQGRHIELAGSEARCLVDGDPDAISVALRNLLDNAVKYSPECPTVWVEWGVRNEFLAIEVRDKGPGIPDSEKKAIFRKFVRGTAAKATNAKGSGVGLAMVRHIAAAHGGAITVASRPGEGSAFTMLLPLVGRA
ncbi:MAG TPA: HAMP domain-containing sensor histidine kinase [Bryobacteraceae bacterium]|nr:HAMP domain-containing sensor histidine kinase [Bryobacteraceae bacterium]